MSGRFVRSSKYRHVFGRSTRKESCYDNLRVSRNAWDTNLVKANPKYLSVNWEASGGGAFAVIPIEEKGRLPEHIPLFRGHTAVVLDTDWSPFNDSLIASASDDAKAFIWRVPEGFKVRADEGEELKDVAPVAKLTGHSRKLGHVLFNPAAENILATSSGDYTIKIWDIEAGSPKLTLKHGDIVQGLSWSANGSLLVTTSRDKKLRIWDARQEKPAHVGPGHGGAKASRVTWMGEHDRIATTGFSKMSDRQLGLWDVRKPDEPMDGFERLDSGSGVCMPFWDDGTQCLYLAGKGDGNIRYFEYQNDKFEPLSEYKSADPQRGVAFLPKRGVNVHENEVMRAFKTVNDSYIEPISFIVPRRAEVFQDDIYPPAVGSKPALSSSEWFGGKDGLPSKIDLGAVYNGEEPTEVAAAADHQPPSPKPAPVPSPTKQSANTNSEPAPAPTPSALPKGPPPSMTTQTASIKDLASKYHDSSDTSPDSPNDDNSSSSFEEVAKPLDRPSHPTTTTNTQPSSSSLSQQQQATAPPPTTTRNLGDPLSPIPQSSKPDDFAPSTSALDRAAASTSTSSQIAAQREPLAQSRVEPLPEQLPSTTTASAGGAGAGAGVGGSGTSRGTGMGGMGASGGEMGASGGGMGAAAPKPSPSTEGSGGGEVLGSLAEIKSLLEEQSKTMSAQNETIGKLTREVDRLRAKMGE